MAETRAMTSRLQNNNELISIEEFVDRLPEWNMDQYVHTIQGKKMLSLQGANFVAWKCGISITGVEVIEETDEYIDVIAVSEYRDRLEKGSKRQKKSPEMHFPFENAVQKARRNAICNQIPHDVIVGAAKPPNAETPYIILAKKIEEAHLAAQAAAREHKDNLISLGLSNDIILAKAKEMNGLATDEWSVGSWKVLKNMIENPVEWELVEESDEEPDDDAEEETSIAEVDKPDVEEDEVGI